MLYTTTDSLYLEEEMSYTGTEILEETGMFLNN